MKKTVAIVSLLVLFCPMSKAAFTDFEDLAVGLEYSAGDSFQSNAISFDVVDLDFPGGTIRVFDDDGPVGSRAGGGGHELGFAGFSINFVLPQGAIHISTLFTVGSSMDLSVNDVAAPTSNGLASLDGTVIEGVSITIGPGAGASNQGELILEGPISSLILGGSEVWIDNVTIIIPEPSTTAMLIAAGVSLLTTRRRHRV